MGCVGWVVKIKIKTNSVQFQLNCLFELSLAKLNFVHACRFVYHRHNIFTNMKLKMNGRIIVAFDHFQVKLNDT